MRQQVEELSTRRILAPALFGDQPLTELSKTDSGEPPWLNFKKAFAASKAGDAATARRELMSVTDSEETRVQLMAWNALRDLGARPEAKSADVVRGIVVELHNEAGIGAISAYATAVRGSSEERAAV
ncbi:MAG TPA: hypothetical protein VJ276_20555 [Thermoanaerobaculia bacterium]|nr:hypothetical protein [Thermoanaerobaculia bacterium]